MMYSVLKSNFILPFSSLIISVLSSHAPVVAQCPPAYVFAGEATGDRFGVSVASAGDVNNDGFDDVIVGAHLNDAVSPNAGRAYVYSGLNGDLIYSFNGESAGNQFGVSVACAGDVNDDGYDDVIVGAYFNGAGGTRAGRAYVWSGLNGTLIHTFTGERPNDRFGISVASAGDVDGDGYDDLIVGAYFSSSPEAFAGRAYVFSGRSGDTLHVFSGEGYQDALGLSVSSAGDVNADGYDDLIVGAPNNDGGSVNAGRAYVFSGFDGDTLHVYTGEAADDKLGVSVASAGDVNADGHADLIVGAFLNDAGGEDAGRAYVFSGMNGDTLYVFSGETAGDQLGRSVASAGDVNGDGRDDLIVGAFGDDDGGFNAGKAFVYSGLNGDILNVFTGEAAGDILGFSVASAGDVNDDGHDDLIVGAFRNDAGGDEAGRAYVYSGRPCVCGDIDGDGTVTREDFDAFIQFYFYAGPPPLGISDVNCSGQTDLADIMYLIYYIKGAIPELCCLNTPTPPDRQRLYYEGIDIK